MLEQGYFGRMYLGQEGQSGEHLKLQQQRGLRGSVSLPGPFHEFPSLLHPNSGAHLHFSGEQMLMVSCLMLGTHLWS